MAISGVHKEVKFRVGDIVDLHQKLVEMGKDGKKERIQVFQGQVIALKGSGEGKSITLRRIGSQGVGIELIMPLHSPMLEKIEVVREGGKGSRRAKLYVTRKQSKKEVERIFSRAKRRK